MPSKNDMQALIALCLKVIEDDLGHHDGISSTAIHETEEYVQESPEKKCATTFCSALVLGALTDVHHAAFLAQEEVPCEKLAAFLHNEQDADGTWNYWRKGTTEHERYRCPNDLDDTALAVAALWACRRQQASRGAANGTQLAQITKALIAAETSAGGPYRTWVVSPEQSDWQDVDLAVNANIAWMLQSQGIGLESLPGLYGYLTTAITSHTYGSSYYVHPEMVFYFLARLNLSVETKTVLRDNIYLNLVETKTSGSMLRIASAICALQELCPDDHRTMGELMDMILRIFEVDFSAELKNFLHTPHWPDRICPERFDGGMRRWCVSVSVTAAFCVQACAGYLTHEHHHEHAVQNPMIEKALDVQRQNYVRLLQMEYETFLKTAPTDLADSIRETVEYVTQGNRSSEVHMHAFHVSEMPIELCARVGLAHLLGWSAYAIYDGCLDGQRDM